MNNLQKTKPGFYYKCQRITLPGVAAVRMMIKSWIRMGKWRGESTFHPWFVMDQEATMLVIAYAANIDKLLIQKKWEML